MTSRCSRTVAREYGISTEDVRKIRRGRYGEPVDFLCRDINLLTEAEIRGIRASRRSDDNICSEYLISLELLEEVRNG
jgi:hypothetical protein